MGLMDVNPTSEFFKGFIFDGIDSKGFGVYITGSGVFNAPERDVEMIEIPGRNGAYALDKGRFSNITVTYPAGFFAKDGETFAEGVDALRNALCSRRGYCRLEDDYNPDEYRLAVYKSGLEVETFASDGEQKAGQFSIVFECKPQRYLLEGEQRIAVGSGDIINNPTLFDAKPLLMVEGYGDIGIGGETVKVISGVVGDVTLARATKLTAAWNTSGDAEETYSIPSYVDGDVTLHGLGLVYSFGKGTAYNKITYAGLVVDSFEDTYNDPPTASASASYTSSKGSLAVDIGDITFNGTARTVAVLSRGSVDVTRNGVTESHNITLTITIEITDTKVSIGTSITNLPSQTTSELRTYSLGEITGYSSELANDSTIYIDLDICDAYRPAGSEIIDLNGIVNIPANPPLLCPGNNTITCDGTITALAVVPRWWKV